MRNNLAIACALTLALATPGHAGPDDSLLHDATTAPLSGEARVTASSDDLFVVGTTDGLFGFDFRGDPAFHSLTGRTITDVAIAEDAGVLVAGDSDGFVHFLETDGVEVAWSRLHQAVTHVASDDAGTFVMASSGNLSYGFNATEAPTGPVLSPKWVFNPAVDRARFLFPGDILAGQQPVADVGVTLDGSWGSVATGGYPYTYAVRSSGSSTINFINSFGAETLWVESSPDTQLVLMGYLNGDVYAAPASFSTFSWRIALSGTPTIGRLSNDDATSVLGDSTGRVYYLDEPPLPNKQPQPSWTFRFGSTKKVSAVTVSSDGRFFAAGDQSGEIVFFDARPPEDGGPEPTDPSIPLWTDSSDGAVVGLAMDGAVTRLAGAAGTSALFWDLPEHED